MIDTVTAEKNPNRALFAFLAGALLCGLVVVILLYAWPIQKPQRPPIAAATAPVTQPVPRETRGPEDGLIRVAGGELDWHRAPRTPGMRTQGQRGELLWGQVRWDVPDASAVWKYINYEYTEEDHACDIEHYRMRPCRLAITGRSGRVFTQAHPVMRLMRSRQKRIVRPFGRPTVIKEAAGALRFKIYISRPRPEVERSKLFQDAAGGLFDPAADPPELIEVIVGDRFVFEWRRGVDPEKDPHAPQGP